MRIRRLIRACERETRCLIYESLYGDGSGLRQWVGNGMSIWPMDGLPHFTKEELTVMFGWDEKKLEKIYMEDAGALPVSGEDNREDDVHLKRVGPVFLIGGETVTALESDDKRRPGLIVMVRLEDLEPAAEDCEAYLRDRVIVLKKGMLLEGIVEPYRMPEETRTEIVRILTGG